MNIKNVYNKIVGFLCQDEALKILFVYRFTSLFIANLFFLFNDSTASITNKLFIITSISSTAIILTYLYIKNRDCEDKVKLLVTIETIGNTLILIPSGGVNSPYVWYSLNTLLIASLMLNRKYVWINLFIYLFGSTGAFIAIFQPFRLNLDLFINNKDYILSLFLITYAIQLLGRYFKKVAEKNSELIVTNKQLVGANKKIKNSIEHIMGLYEAIELFCTLKDKGNLIEQLLDCSKKITKSNTIIFYDFLDNDELIINKNTDTDEELRLEIFEAKERVEQSLLPVEINLNEKSYLLFIVKSNYLNYGILGIEINFPQDSWEYRDNIEQLQFLSGLCSITLEKFELEQVKERLLITEEQNRIASEIHDSVLQRLFSISCGIYSINQNCQKLNLGQISNELNIIRYSINNTMKELRSAIYGLSWAKDGRDNFETDIVNYINEIKKLNNVEVDLKLLGNQELLTTMERKAFYRVICEGISNAIQHGKAKHIEIVLYRKQEAVLLNIVDNGSGLNTEKMNDNKKDCGLGLKNIYNLVYSLNGDIKINSELGQGTSIEICIPNKGKYAKGGIA